MKPASMSEPQPNFIENKRVEPSPFEHGRGAKTRSERDGFIHRMIINRKIVYLLLACLIGIGGVGLFLMNKDEFPTFELKQGLIVGIYPGANAEEVERQLTEPLEELLFAFSEIDRAATYSYSQNGICYIYTDLTVEADRKNEVWSKIKLKLNESKMLLPPGVLAVRVLDEFSSVSALLITLEASDKSYREMSRYAEALEKRLKTIPEVAKVAILGEQTEEIALTVDMERLSAYGINPAALLFQYKTGSLQLPAGAIDNTHIQAPLHFENRLTSEQAVADHLLFATPDGHAIRMGDVADAERRYKEPTAIVKYNGHTALVLSVEMRPDNNIVAFGKEVDAVLADFQQTLPESVRLSRITDQPKVVRNSVYSFLRDLVISMVVVIAVMLLLFPIRSALIASSGVPICIAVTLAFMYLCGIDLNTVTLAALIVVLGMIVDDAIITMDGYMNQLGQSHAAGRNLRTPARPNDRKILAATASANELFMPQFMATVAICAMFFPIKGLISGYLGEFVSLFPYVITIALMTSLAYAMCVVPSLEVRFIDAGTGDPTRRVKGAAAVQKRFFDGLQRIYERAEGWCFRHPRATLLTGVGSIVIAVFFFTRLNIQMMPMAARDYFAVEIKLEGAAGLDATEAVADSMTRLLLDDRRVTSVTAFIGTGAPRFNATYEPMLPGKNTAQLIVNTHSTKATETLLAELENRYEFAFPNARLRFKQMDYQAVKAPVAVEIKGDRLETLLPAAERIQRHMAGMNETLQWVHADFDGFQPTIEVRLSEEEAARLGVNRSLVSLSLAGLSGGQTLTTIWEENGEIPVTLYSRAWNDSADYRALENQMVPTAVPGLSVPLRQVGSIHPDWGVKSRPRKAGTASVTVSADMKQACSQPEAMADIQRFVTDSIRPILPQDATVEYGGLSAVNDTVIPEILLSFICAVAILFFFMLFHFKKISLAALTLTLSLLCMFGAFLGLWIFRLDFGLTAVLGLISLVGIIVRNGIIMFEYADELRMEHGLSAKNAAMEAGKRRMRPIFLTSCTTALGVLPMIISGDALWRPMGVVICFGTMLSIVLIVLIMPVSYWQIFNIGNARKRREADGFNQNADSLDRDVDGALEDDPADRTVVDAMPAARTVGDEPMPATETISQRFKGLPIWLLLMGGLGLSAAGSASAMGSASISASASAACIVTAGAGMTDTLYLSLSDCLEQARSNDLRVRNAELDERAALAQKREALAAYFPNVNVQAFGFGALDPLLDLGITDILGTSAPAYQIQQMVSEWAASVGVSSRYKALGHGYTATVSATQPVFAGGRIVNSNRLANVGVKAAALRKDLTVRETLEETERAYWQVVSLQEKRGTLRQAMTLLDSLHKDVASARKAGLATATDLLQVKLKQNELKAKELELNNGLLLAKMNLCNQIGWPYRPDNLGLLVFSDRLDEAEAPENYYQDEESLLAQQEEIRLLNLSVEAKRLEKKIVTGEALPQIGVGATYGYGHLLHQGEWNGLLYVSAKIPLSDWGGQARKIQRYDCQLQKAENERDFLSDQLLLQLRKLRFDLHTAWEQLQLAKDAEQTARAGMEQTLAHYKAGLATLAELLQAQLSQRECADRHTDQKIAYKTALQAYLNRLGEAAAMETPAEAGTVETTPTPAETAPAPAKRRQNDRANARKATALAAEETPRPE